MRPILTLLDLQVLLICEHHRVGIDRIDEGIKAVGQVKVEDTEKICVLIFRWI